MYNISDQSFRLCDYEDDRPAFVGTSVQHTAEERESKAWIVDIHLLILDLLPPLLAFDKSSAGLGGLLRNVGIEGEMLH